MTSIPINNTSTFLYKNKLFFAANSGIISIDLSNFFPFLNVILYNDSVQLKFLTENAKTENLKTLLLSEINYKLSTLNNVLKKKLILFGIGFRSWSYKANDSKNYLILKIGFSRDVLVEIPKSVIAISLKPTLILLKSVNKSKLSQFVSLIRSFKKPDIYKGKGIQYINEIVKLKVGKNN